MFQCYSLKSSHPHLLPQSPKVYSLHLCLFCCLAYRVIIIIFLNSIYMFSDKKFRGWWLLLLFHRLSDVKLVCLRVSYSFFLILLPLGSKAGCPNSRNQVGNQGRKARKEHNASDDCLLYERNENFSRNSSHTSICISMTGVMLHGSPWKSLERKKGWMSKYSFQRN